MKYPPTLTTHHRTTTNTTHGGGSSEEYEHNQQYQYDTSASTESVPTINYSSSAKHRENTWDEEENISSGYSKPKHSYRSLLLIPVIAILNLCLVLYFYIPLHSKLNIRMVWSLDDLKKDYDILIGEEAVNHSFELFCLFCCIYLFVSKLNSILTFLRIKFVVYLGMLFIESIVIITQLEQYF